MGHVRMRGQAATRSRSIYLDMSAPTPPFTPPADGTRLLTTLPCLAEPR